VAAEKMLGCAAADVVGGPLDRFVPLPFRAAHAGHVEGFGRTGVTSRSMRSLGTLMALRSDGTEFPIEASISHMEVEGQRLYTVILRDITARVEAERTLRESDDRLQAVTENLSEGLIISDLQGASVHWNRSALLMHGFKNLEDGLQQLPAFASIFSVYTLAGEELPLDRWPLARVMASETLSDVEVRVHRIGTDWARVFSCSGSVVAYGGGRRMAYLSISDISARKHAETEILSLNSALEQRVQERTAQLEAKGRELESFCYSVSHDLKAPLRGIDGYSRLLLEDHGERLGEEGRLFALNVRTATQQMTALIEDLLTYSRQERRNLTLGRVGLRSFVAQQIAGRGAELAGRALEVDVPDVQVAADPEALAMALRNLLDNAIKFSATRDLPIVRVSAHAGEGRCVLSVQDNGTGFDMRFHDRIFEIFQRLHRVEDYPGTGIGLALVRKAVERMGGRVWAESAVDAGATFHLELALVAEPPATADPTGEPLHGRTAPHPVG
jgi:PAS domain S-box-containing protein